MMPRAFSDKANEAGKNSSSRFHLANGLFHKPNRFLVIVAVGDVNEAKPDRKPVSLDEIENDIHRVIADILPGLIGRFSSPSESQSEIGPEAWGSTRKNRSWFLIWTISSSVCRLGFNPQTLSAGALSQAEDDIGSVLFDGVEKLALVKPNWEDDFFAPAASRQPADNFLRNVILKLAVGAKAVDEETHRNSIKIGQAIRSHVHLSQLREPVILRLVTPVHFASLLH